ncbi:MAG: hypothetical protein R3F36_11995 [Candidatus Competibacteraceae bacterium]
MLDARIQNSVVAAGSMVRQAKITNTIIRREVIIEDDGNRGLPDSGVRSNQTRRPTAACHHWRLQRGIEAGTCIGYDLEQDRKLYQVTQGGITVVGPGEVTATMQAFSE